MREKNWKYLTTLTTAMAVVAGVTLVLLSLLVTVTVVLRYGFGIGTGWSTEISTYMLFVIALSAAPQIQIANKHIALDLIVPRLRQSTQIRLRRVTSAIGALISVAIVAYGTNYTATLFERGDAVARVLSVPKWIFMAYIAFSFAVLSLVFVVQAFGGFSKGHDHEFDDYAELGGS